MICMVFFAVNNGAYGEFIEAENYKNLRQQALKEK
jgi:hypothetical protein